jgi:hydrogenase expression/formation protein HypC
MNAASRQRAAEQIGPEQISPDVPECHGEVCVTCADSAVAVTVLRLLEDDLALVRTAAGQEEVSVALVTARVGDTILVHAREAIAVVGTGPA